MKIGNKSNILGAKIPDLLVDAAFAEDECIIGVNGLALAPSISFLDGEFYLETGAKLRFPSDKTRERAAQIAQNDIKKVFVVEFGPMGPIAVHSVKTGH